MKASVTNLARHIYYRTPGLKRLAIKNPHVMQSLGTIIHSTDATFLGSMEKSPLFRLRQIRIALAENIHSPKELIIKLTKNRNEQVRIAAVKSPALLETELEVVLKRPFESLDVKGAVRKNPAIIKLLEQAQASNDPAILSTLAQKPFSCVRIEAAKNINTSTTTLNMLSRDKIWTVATAAAKNPKTHWEAIADLLGKVKKKKIGRQELKLCPDGVYNVGEEEFQYPDETFELAQALLETHKARKQEILEKLKELNPEFHEFYINIANAEQIDQEYDEMFPKLPITWNNFYQEIVYRENHYIAPNWGTDLFGLSIAGSVVGIAALALLWKLDILEPEKWMLAAFSIGFAILGALFPALHKHTFYPAKTLSQYLYRRQRSSEDFQLATNLREFYLEKKTLKRLKSILSRIKDLKLADMLLQSLDIDKLLYHHKEGSIVTSYLLAKHPETSEEKLAELLKHENVEVKAAVPENLKIRKLVEQAKVSTSPEELIGLGKKPFPCIQATVATNIHTPSHLLEELSEHDQWMVKIASAANKNTPWEKVAIVLSQIRPDTYLKTIPAEKWYAAWICPLGDKGMPEREVEVKYYPRSVTEKVINILSIHKSHELEILEQLGKLNPKLFNAVT